jgi:hypothetical protein
MAKKNGNDNSKSKSRVKNKRRVLSPAQQVRFEKRCTAVDAVWGVATIQDEMGHIASELDSFLSANSRRDL